MLNSKNCLTQIIFFFASVIGTVLAYWFVDFYQRGTGKLLIADEGVYVAYIKFLSNDALTPLDVSHLRSYSFDFLQTKYTLIFLASKFELLGLSPLASGRLATILLYNIGIILITNHLKRLKLITNQKALIVVSIILLCLPSILLVRSFAIRDAISAVVLGLICTVSLLYLHKTITFNKFSIYILLLALLLGGLQYLLIMSLCIIGFYFLIVLKDKRAFVLLIISPVVALAMVQLLVQTDSFAVSRFQVITEGAELPELSKQVISSVPNPFSRTLPVAELSSELQKSAVVGSLIHDLKLDKNENLVSGSANSNLINGLFYALEKISFIFFLNVSSLEGFFITLESMFWLVFSVIVLRHALVMFLHPEVGIVTSYYLILSGGILMYDENFGTYFRHRASLLPILVISFLLIKRRKSLQSF